MSSMAISLAEKLGEKFNMMSAGDDLIQVLKSTAFKGQVSDAQMAALMVVANQHGLNPFTREIYAFPDKGGIVPVVGVDGWSRIINSHPQFDGMDFEQDAESCTCIIYRKDRGHPIKVTEWMAECSRNTGPWQSHPRRMLRHKAMIQCARIAFGFSGIYDEDEAQRIVERDVTPAANEDPSSAVQAIENAQSMEELQAAFAAAWRELPGSRALLTKVKDERKAALSQQPIEAEEVVFEEVADDSGQR